MQKRSVRDFLNIILNGTALGVVAGLIPNAVLSTLFKCLQHYLKRCIYYNFLFQF